MPKRLYPTRTLFVLLITTLVLSACYLPLAGASEPTGTPLPAGPTTTPAASPTTAPSPTELPTPLPALDVSRIQIRTVEGAAEFYNTSTGETFTPRGVNYIHFLPTERNVYQDRVMSSLQYDRERVREAFRHLAGAGYNTVRIFFENCSYGPGCFALENGEGLNPDYLDNMVDLMYIAGEEGIYIIFTANAIPEGGGYSQHFDTLMEGAEQDGFGDWRNADWLHTAGVETKRKIWQDLMNGLAERAAPFEVILGWQLTNEFWLWGEAPPLSLNEGLVTIASGQTYDMADPEQKHRMVVEGMLYFMEEIVAEIKAVDPEGLTTIGFYAPRLGPDRYILTPDWLYTAPVDFWDFHAYFDTELTIYDQAESFGMIGYKEKPVIMGETGGGHEFLPSAATALAKGVEWVAGSCEFGFDGWLYWGYYPWPDDLPGAAWAPLEQDELIFQAMSPSYQPDACVVPELPVVNAAFRKPVRASAFEPSQPPEQAVDGSNTAWTAGAYPPQWIEVDLGEPTTIGRVAMNTDQWPPGVSRHQVSARLADGRNVLLGELSGFTMPGMILAIDLPIPLPEVRSVRITTTESSSWAGWMEIEAVAAAAQGNACLGTLAASTVLQAGPWPDAEQGGTLTAGSLVYINGLYTDEEGTAWARSGGAWLPLAALSLSGDCHSSALVAEPGVHFAPVTFRVTAPTGIDGEVFMAGQFPGMDWEFWRPWMIVLNQVEPGLWEITIPLPLGAEIEYLYTRASWETVERAADCSAIPNRTWTVAGEVIIEDLVAAWSDLDCGDQ